MRKKRSITLLLSLILLLAACSVLPGATGSSSSLTDTQGQNQQNQPPDMTNLPVEQKLVIGTLKLEGTNQAVTAEQAKMLLPLWKAVKSMSSASNTSSEEMNALYAQIQEAMTPEQVQAIKDMSMSMEDTQALMKEYGAEMPGPGGNADPMGNLSEDERATRIAEFRARGGGRQGGDMPGGGPPSGGFQPGGALPEGGFQGGNGQGSANAQGTPVAPQGGRGFRGGMNLLLIDPLIKLLQERAGS